MTAVDGGRSMTELNRVDIRRSHPALYRTIMTISVMKVALAFNFWRTNPTFNPYGWDKNLIGAVFFTLGAGQFVFLNLVRSLRMVRLVLATSISWLLFWGASNTQQFFAHKASLQLPIIYMSIALLQVPLLIEAPVNPLTRKK